MKLPVSPLIKWIYSVTLLCMFLSQRQEINTEKYWRYNFPSLMSSREIEKYVVLSVEPMLSVQRASAKRRYLLTNSQRMRPFHNLIEAVNYIQLCHLMFINLSKLQGTRQENEASWMCRGSWEGPWSKRHSTHSGDELGSYSQGGWHCVRVRDLICPMLALTD